MHSADHRGQCADRPVAVTACTPSRSVNQPAPVAMTNTDGDIVWVYVRIFTNLMLTDDPGSQEQNTYSRGISEADERMSLTKHVIRLLPRGSVQSFRVDHVHSHAAPAAGAAPDPACATWAQPGHSVSSPTIQPLVRAAQFASSRLAAIVPYR